METNDSPANRTDLVHGHSRLTWLMDELDAHLRGLTEASEDTEFILDEFLSYWGQFRDALRAHITEEETELFPVVVSHGTEAEAADLRKLQDQHAMLLSELQGFEDAVGTLLEGPTDERSGRLEALSRRAGELREHLTTHSRDERRFLRNLNDLLTESPPS